jgi:ketosteroid isomerase-like protein
VSEGESMNQIKPPAAGSRAATGARGALLAALGTALVACSGSATPGAASADAGIEAVSRAWKQAYNAGDFRAVTELYADDAVLSAPGLPVVMGKAAIGEYFARLGPVFAHAQLTVTDAPLGRAGTSGDLGFQWKTYRILDKTGSVVDAGKLLTLFRRHDAHWQIIGDTWNSDRAPAP